MRKIVFTSVLLCLIAVTAGAETVNVTAKPNGTVVGSVVPLFNGRVDIVAIGTKKSPKAWGLAVANSRGDTICVSVTSDERTCTCSFAAIADETYTVIVLSGSGSVKVVVNVDGPSLEPFVRLEQRNAVDTSRLVEALGRMLR